MQQKFVRRLVHHIAHAGLPLLAKELTEQAARRRTFVIRVVYATILFLTASLFFYEMLSVAAASPLAVLGRGKEMFSTVVGLQFAGIYLFMPAMTSGVITQEKERASLQLLFLTRLGPWTILFEKLLGRLVPMGCFLLLSMPLLGFAYTLGGVSRELLWKGTWMLSLATIQMGTLALMCSAFFRTTVGAFMASYVLAFLMFFGPFAGCMTLYLVGLTFDMHLDRLLRDLATSIGPAAEVVVMFPFFTPMYFLGSVVAPGGLPSWIMVLHSAIILSVGGGCLVLARRFIVERAFLPPWNPARSLFNTIDRSAVRSGGRQPAEGTATHSDDALLPAGEPVAWRETTKRVLGKSRSMWRIVLIALVPLMALCWLLGVTDSPQATTVVSALMQFVMWVLAVLIISVKSASLVAGERTHQTLDVLCTSPLTGREIVLQKFRGVRRLIIALWVPFMTISLFVPWWTEQHRLHRSQMWSYDKFSAPLYLTCSALSICIYFPLVAWLSLLIGLKVRTQIRAIIGSMAAITAWCLGPLIFIVMPLSIIVKSMGRSPSDVWQGGFFLSPAAIIFINGGDWQEYNFDSSCLCVLLNFTIYGAALIAIRAICLKNADRWLGRAEAKVQL